MASVTPPCFQNEMHSALSKTSCLVTVTDKSSNSSKCGSYMLHMMHINVDIYMMSATFGTMVCS